MSGGPWVVAGAPLLADRMVVSREVRWFRPGPLPHLVLEWFSGSKATLEREHRVDWYDPDSAGRGVGAKWRGSVVFDVKVLLSHRDGVELAPGLSGRVEDWLKVSDPAPPAQEIALNGRVAVDKTLLTRYYRLSTNPDLNGQHQPAGCSVELASIAAIGVQFWSLCLETFGAPELRAEAFRSGIEGLLADTPLPGGLQFTPELSHGYPMWIRTVAPPASAPSR